ncbi:hypothetical protein PF002_g25045 [Phytophthora fragariae]|uniref:Reverse transcriptase/retrotransposon-derived protein RNase H-like domain-containing protein n=1 Tax=Phytophthora fragariae TaxID=53985 RepID=A0A6A3WUW8_9STRA|nr:hypothetical protein PF006_g25989 [Phytophthora fragariae]KAE9189427.1 hypothetical protein PF002_g25045 [Phytophthora fragariae]KAE9282779.1 hypothetical protein PF001_g23144 [Phytophthora fragariae]
MDPKKSDSIRNWPVPKTKHDMQAFIGTCVYVMRFCADFAEHVAVLTEVIRDRRPRDPVSLNPQQLAAFNILKTKLTPPPVLAHPDFSKPFHVNVDASDFAIGGYLFQLDENKAEKVIAYGGRKLSKPEMVYPTREKELLAALHAMPADMFPKTRAMAKRARAFPTIIQVGTRSVQRHRGCYLATSRLE